MAEVGNLIIKIIGDNKGLTTALDQSSKDVSKFSSGAGKFAKGAAIGLAATATAAIGAGTALFKVGESFDEAYDTIRIGTGATGEQLAALEGDMREVAKVVPADFGTIGTAIADLNTRLGLTGKPLQDMTTQMVNLANITETDVSSVIQEATRLFGNWQIAAKDQASSLDFLFKVSQNTGIGVDKLTQSMTSSGVELRTLGFDFETSAAMLGMWEKEGVNAETAISSLKIGLRKIVQEEGVSAPEAFAQIVDSIKNAGSASEAAALGVEYFGRGGATMAEAIRTGKLEVDDLVKTLEGSDETINKAAEDTWDFAEQFKMFKNNVMTAIEPLAKTIFGMAGDFMKIIGDKLIPKIAELAESFAPLIEKVMEFIPVLLEGLIPVLTQIMDAILPIFESLLSVFVDKLLPPLMTVITTFVDTILPPLSDILLRLIDTVVIPLLGFIGDIVNVLLPPFIEIIGILMEMFAPIADVLGTLVQMILPPLTTIITLLAQTILPPLIALLKASVPLITLMLELFAGLVGSILPPLVEIISKLITVALKPLTSAIEWLSGTVIPTIMGIFENWKTSLDGFRNFMVGIKDSIVQIWTNVKDFFSGIWDNILAKVNTFKEGFLGVWNGIKNGIKASINAIIGFLNGLIGAMERAVNWIISGLNRIHFEIPDWVPDIGGREFGINLKEVSFGRVPTLAEGGFIERGGFAIVGERGPELVGLPSGAFVSPFFNRLDVSGRITIDIAGEGIEHLDSDFISDVVSERLIDSLKQEVFRR